MITLTESAIDKVRSYLNPVLGTGHNVGFRIQVTSGGCVGYRYAFMVDVQREDDVTSLHNGVWVYVDRKSYPLLEGSELDFVDTVQEVGWKVSNKKWVNRCGCGESFFAEKGCSKEGDT